MSHQLEPLATAMIKIKSTSIQHAQERSFMPESVSGGGLA